MSYICFSHDGNRKYSFDSNQFNDILSHFTAKFQLHEGYPTLMFFKTGANDSVMHRGPQDVHTLMAFVHEQMGRKPIEIKVSKMK